jgi:hypothetical protein
MNWEQRGRKLCSLFEVCLEGLRKTLKHLQESRHIDQNLNPGQPYTKQGLLPRCSMYLYSLLTVNSFMDSDEHREQHGTRNMVFIKSDARILQFVFSRTGFAVLRNISCRLQDYISYTPGVASR